VALKVVRSDTDCTREVQIHDVLRANAEKHQGSSYIMKLKDHFSIQGPNGNHYCLAYEVLGPSIARVRENYLDTNGAAYLTLSCAREIVYQVLLGLDYMHSVGVVHGDLYAANVLFALRELSEEPLETLRQPDDQISMGVKRVNGPLQPGDPRHLSLDRPLNLYLSADGNVKISDLGNSERCRM
jgi:serine/threonine protein kinase